MELADIEGVLTAAAAGCIGVGSDGVGVAVGSTAATKEFAVIRDPLWAGSAQPPAS